MSEWPSVYKVSPLTPEEKWEMFGRPSLEPLSRSIKHCLNQLVLNLIEQARLEGQNKKTEETR